MPRWMVWCSGVLMTIVVSGFVVDGYVTAGGTARGARLARMERSAQWQDGRFENPQPISNDLWGAFTGLFGASSYRSPNRPLPIVTGARDHFQTLPATGLRVTWLGHSTSLLEIDGHRVLVDPVWGERASPFGWMGPRRWYPPPLALAELPPLDAIVISHDHYDHLDRATITALKERETTFVVPLGVGAFLAAWGVPEPRIIELDWWERARVRDLEIVCTPARHASGRGKRRNGTLWSGFALMGGEHKVYYSGDTGPFSGFAEIGERLGPFDLTMIEAGAYDRAWPDWHLGPEQAVAAHGLVRGRVMLPVHWGLFTLAYHGWTEPIERVLAAGEKSGARIIAPRPGESVEPATSPELERWWPDVPWSAAEQTPVIASGTE